ncbi:putative long-chain fatty acid transport protein [Waddlia chondrophila 2032/99]|uniref:Putative long-chain fatty acid transport protein n=1 Tax=Waddlia chondrophila 2032/99 TaxID=765953 RepID=F8LB31_9BACT|nr:putative long-chain fatty acid transport protein [Waddlia chondrophila 2032/99]
MKFLRKTIPLALTLLPLFFGPTLEANLYKSPKALGRAGAVAASPQDAMTIAYNPAAAAFVGNRWDLGLTWIHNLGRHTYSENANIDGIFDPFANASNLFVPEFGVNQRMCECTMTWGFLIYNQEYFKVDYKTPNPLFGTSNLGLEYLHYVASPSWSILFGCDHALGITLDFHGHRLKIDGLENFANDFNSANPNLFTNKGYDYAGAIGATVGWISHLAYGVNLGLSYSPPVDWIIGRFNDYRGSVADEALLELPARYLAGLQIEMVCGLFAEFDVEHVQYNQVRPLNQRLLPAFEEEHGFGAEEGVGLGWRDQTIFRFGLEWQWDENFALRAGWWHHRTPIVSSETLANTLVPNVLEDYVTWGGTMRCGCLNEISFFGAYGFKSTIYGQDSIPEDLGGGEVDLEGEKWMFGMSWGRRF